MPTKFYLENRPNKKGECMIRVSIMMKSNRLITSIGSGYSINPMKWDISKQCVKKGSINSRGLSYAEINNRINTIASEFQTLESEAIGGKPISQDSLKKLWSEKFSKSPKKTILSTPETTDDTTFFGLFQNFIDEQKRVQNWHPMTEGKFASIKKQLKAFNPDLQFEDVNKEMLAKYCAFLTKDYKLINSTVKKHIAHLKQFFRWAVEQQIITTSPILQWKPKLDSVPKPIIYLDWEELMKLYNHKIDPNLPGLERVRDCFVFQCFTGLRYSDLYNLRKSDIRGNSIFITTIKTSDSLEIQLNDYSKAILDKYSDEVFFDDKALPVISNQKMNDALKTICEIVEFNTPIRMTIYKGTERKEVTKFKYDLIGTHCGRRTFISNAIMLGIAPDIVMKWTGHSDYKAMKPYIEIADKAKGDAMKLFNKKNQKT